MLSIQTNVTSLIAQQNLSTNNTFQSKTIQQLTSGYRINSAGDDAAGLAVANGFRDSVAELTQGVQNANNGVANLQIIDGGLSNVSNILDRLQTLATESASTTFTGNRTTLNNEFQTLLGEIDRQATNIGLSTGGTNAYNQQTYIGGASSANSNAEVSVNLVNGAVDTKALKLSGTSVIGGGVGFANDTTNLNDTSALYLNSSNGGAGGETFSFNYVDASGNLQSQSVTLASQSGGFTGTAAVAALNKAMSNAGITNITASIGSSGALQFSGPAAFTVTTSTNFANNPANGNNSTTLVNQAATNMTYNSGVYTMNAKVSLTNTGAGEQIAISVGGDTFTYALGSGGSGDDTLAHLATDLNSAVDSSGKTLASMGVYAMVNSSTAGGALDNTNAAGNILLASASAFTVNNVTAATNAGDGMFLDSLGAKAAANANEAVSGPVTTSSATGMALQAIDRVTAAVQQLGTVQGIVGAGENQLNYAISLAQSQITNFSSAQSQIRDTDVAAQAANLSKAQVLQQASIAAMAQANSAPQQVLALLRQ